MNKEPTFKELIDHINSSVEARKGNSAVGFFVSEHSTAESEEQPLGKETSSFHAKKPAINISPFVAENELYYEVSFHFNSINDSDYKQMWKFLSRYAAQAKREAEHVQSGTNIDKVSVLAVSIVPDLYRGKYFVYINMPFADTICCTENAYENTAKISFFCAEDCLDGAVADDDIIDPRSIEREVESEFAAETENYDPALAPGVHA